MSSLVWAEKGERKEAVHETGDSLGGEGEQRGREDIALQAIQEKIIIHQAQMEPQAPGGSQGCS